MTDLDVRLLPGKLKPQLVYPFNVLRPESSRVLAEDVEPRLRGIREEDLQRERVARRRQGLPLLLQCPGLFSSISELRRLIKDNMPRFQLVRRLDDRHPRACARYRQ